MPGLRARVGAAIILALAGWVVACTVPPAEAPRRPAVRMPSVVRVRANGRIVTVPLEDYVLGSSLSEVTPLNETAPAVRRIYEVQSVLARTYAVSHLGRHRAEGFDLCDGTHCQLYEPSRIATSRFTPAARAAVQATEGRVLIYAGQPIEALFHADCGGSTDAAGNVWGRSVPYLLATPDDVPGVSHRDWRVVMSLDELRTALNADNRSRVGRRLTGLEVSARDPSGRAAQVRIEGERPLTLRGEDLRSILNRAVGNRGIQSTKFTLSRVGSSVRFEGQGFGHGVGLCQIGAAARARRGDSLAAILTAYYKGATLVGW